MFWLCPLSLVYLTFLTFKLWTSLDAQKSHLKLLLERSLIIDTRELIFIRLVSQVVSRTGIVHVAKFDKHLDLAVFARGFSPGHMNWPGIQVRRVKASAVL